MATDDRWQAIQDGLWACEACKGHSRVQLNNRQQTPAPDMDVALLFVGVAPPEQGSPVVRTVAKSATNDPGDNLRRFIEGATVSRWDDLVAKGAFLIHAVKCAIVPDEEGFQNPPHEVVDRCCPVGFADELALLRPARVVAFGGAACRAVLKHPSLTAPRGAGVSKTLEQLQETWPQGIPCSAGGRLFTLHVSPFPRPPKAKKRARIILREAALCAGILPAVSHVTQAGPTPQRGDFMKSTTFQLKGKMYTISWADVIRVGRSVPPERVTKFYVEIDGRRFPPTQLVRVGANTPEATYSANSRSILTHLGFTVKSLG